MSHKINKLITELHLGKSSNSLEAQAKTSAFVRSKVIPMVENLLDKYDVKDKVIRVDKLELNLGNFDPYHENTDALWKIECEFEEKLQDLVRGIKTGDSLKKKELPVYESETELFFHLLGYGVMPWWGPAHNQTKFAELAQKLFSDPSASLQQKFREAMESNLSRQRLVLSLPLSLVEVIFEKTGYNAQALKEAKIWLNRYVKDSDDFETILRLIYKEALAPSLTPPDVFKLMRAVKKASRSGSNKFIPRLVEQIIQKLAEYHKVDAENDDGMLTTGKAKEQFTENKNSAALGKEGEEEYHISNAGMVILAPFLPHYFKNLKLLSGNKFEDETVAARAVTLLQHLATGQESDFEEHEMLFSKILCGVPVHRPLQINITVSEVEKKEGMEMLTAITQHWKAIGNTSPEGMRSSFLLRDGKLTRNNNGWDLKVERTTLDVLLDRLPWGISVIKLPWSEEVIFVDWT